MTLLASHLIFGTTTPLSPFHPSILSASRYLCSNKMLLEWRRRRRRRRLQKSFDSFGAFLVVISLINGHLF